MSAWRRGKSRHEILTPTTGWRGGGRPDLPCIRARKIPLYLSPPTARRPLQNFFLACALLGGAVLLLQLLFGLAGAHGVGHDASHDAHDHEHASEGLHLFSVRALSAGLASFGATGLGVYALGGGALLAIPLSVLVGSVAMVAVAMVLRAMLKLEDDGTVMLQGAVGLTGAVYLTIPGGRSGAGKVHLTLQNRTVEVQAVTPEASLPTGAPVLVVDVVGPDTVEVVPNPMSPEVANAV